MQRTLAVIIGDFVETLSSTDNERISPVPDYIRTLFHHYCWNKEKPRFEGIDQIQHKMVSKLQELLFIEVIDIEKVKRRDSKKEQKISHQKVQLLFPNLVMYINDQGEQVSTRSFSVRF